MIARALQRMRGAWLGVLLAGLMLHGCADGILIYSEFTADPGVMADDPVYLGDVRVGSVRAVDRVGPRTQVEMMLDPTLVKELRAGSAALVSERNGARVVYLYNAPAGEPVAPRAVLVGLNSSLELALWQAGGVFQGVRDSMAESLESWEGYFESEEWQERKHELEQGLQQLEAESAATMQAMQDNLSALLDEMERRANSASEQAQKQYAELSQRLAEQLQILAEKGEQGAEEFSDLIKELARTLEQSGEQ